MLLKEEVDVFEVSTKGLEHNYINLYQLCSYIKDTAMCKAATFHPDWELTEPRKNSS